MAYPSKADSDLLTHSLNRDVTQSQAYVDLAETYIHPDKVTSQSISHLNIDLRAPEDILKQFECQRIAS
jgi:hypothetical protein